MLRKLTIATTLALALLGAAGCGSTDKTPENPEVTNPTPNPAPDPSKPVVAPPCPETEPPDSATASATAPQPEPCKPPEPEVCNSGPGDKRCPEKQ